MPRFAAIVLGLTLVAISIGLNTARYPVVWEMAGRQAAVKSAEVAVAPQPAKADKQASDNKKKSMPAESQPPKPIEVKPKPAVAKKQVVESPRLVEAGAADASAATNNPANREMESRLPLVPVAKVVSSGTSERGAVGGDTIRRLPPVEAGNFAPADRGASIFAGGSIPFYPTTGIE